MSGRNIWGIGQLISPRSIIAAIGAIANVVGMTQMQPPVKDLCK